MIKKKLGKFGSRFAFEVFLEFMHDEIVKELRKYLSSIQPGDIRRMVRKGEFPPLDHDFSAIGDNTEHLKRISVVRLMELLAEARPDLAATLQDMGTKGAEYLVKLRLHLLEMVRHPEKPLAESTDYKPASGGVAMVLATCEQCGKSWPVPKAEASSLDKCPFCGQ